MKCLFCLLALLLAARAGEVSPAEVDLLKASKTVPAGGTVDLALKFELKPGWHTYWTNPGEGGMPISVEWTLPDGWSGGALQYPVPERFVTGSLVGYGYADQVVIPLPVTAAEGAKGMAKIRAEVQWLTCDETRCVAGDAIFETTLRVGEAEPTDAAAVIAAARERVPRMAPELSLTLIDRGEELEITLTPIEGVNPELVEVFPVTRDVVDPAEILKFKRVGERWAIVAKASSYLSRPVPEFELVLAGKALPRARTVRWEAEEK